MLKKILRLIAEFRNPLMSVPALVDYETVIGVPMALCCGKLPQVRDYTPYRLMPDIKTEINNN